MKSSAITLVGVSGAASIVLLLGITVLGQNRYQRPADTVQYDGGRGTSTVTEWSVARARSRARAAATARPATGIVRQPCTSALIRATTDLLTSMACRWWKLPECAPPMMISCR